MGSSSRQFLVGAAAATVGAAVVGVPELAGANETISHDKIARLFADLPGKVAYKIVAPATRRTRRVELASNSAQQLFIGSAFKTFVLGEALRQADSPEVVQIITQQQL